MQIRIVPNDKGNPPGKLADAELHFTDGPLAGLKLIGFAVWERRTGSGRNVTFPARQYSVNGERRSFALLRPVVDTTAPLNNHLVRSVSQCAGISPSQGMPESRRGARASMPRVTARVISARRFSANSSSTRSGEPIGQPTGLPLR
jgi:hypothetical protein